MIRAGAIAGFLLAFAYLAITALYLQAGPVPIDADGQAWLAYLDGQQVTWWGITGLSVLTDLLFVPLLAALYMALGSGRRTVLLGGIGLVGAFVVLDLAVTWPNYAALIDLSGRVASADQESRLALVGAATYAAAVLDSLLFAIYAILLPAVGILAISLVMWETGFGRVPAVLGMATGLLGYAVVVGGLVAEPLGALAIPTSILTLLWVVTASLRLWNGADQR